MRLLLDTNVVLRLSLQPGLLRPDVVSQLEADTTTMLLSAVVHGEISIKWRTGRLPLPVHPRAWVARLVREFGVEALPIAAAHAVEVADLPRRSAPLTPDAMMAPVTEAPRAEAVVDLAAIRHNVAVLAAASPGAALMAVVKAEGYGHGAVPVARAALEAGAGWLGVCTIEEALDLRAAGITAPVLSWLHLPGDDYAAAIAADVDLSVASREHLTAIVAGAARAGRPARLHLKVDTGLSRNGVAIHDWADVLDDAAKAVADGLAAAVAVWSHLAHADAPQHPTLDVQADRLTAAWQAARDRGLAPIRHLANSAATLTRPDLHFDLVRPGIAVYGLDPLGRPAADGPLRPAMTLRARVALVKRVPAGAGVSYGHEWVTPAETTLALLPIGYADGVPRRLGQAGRMRVWLAGRSRPVVGRVCMDQVVVDCGDDPVRAGDEALLFGPGEHGEPTAQDWADELETIHYEVVTGVHGPRVHRSVIDSGAST